MIVRCFAILLLALAGIAPALAHDSNELSFLCFEERNECQVYADLLARFTDENDSVTVSVDMVAPDELDAELARRLEAGAAPDIVRLPKPSALPSQALDLRPLLSDADALAARMPAAFLAATRADAAPSGLYAIPDAIAVVAPFVNLSLFDAAGVAPPAAGSGWDDWLPALETVAQNTDARYALSVDNKEHRLVGPAMSLGARYFDDEGALSLADDSGLRELLLRLQGLMQAGLTPEDTLRGTGKSQDYFVGGETVVYICGSWKAESVAAAVGDRFDWAILPNPVGAGGGAGIGQFTALAALASSPHPEALGQVFDYLTQPAIVREFAERTLTIAALAGVDAPLDYDTADDTVAAALNAFAREVPHLTDQALALGLHPQVEVYYEAANRHLRAFFAGELNLDAALDGIKRALADG